VAEALSRMRTPAILLLIGVAVQVILYLSTIVWTASLLALIASQASSTADAVPGIVIMGVCTAFNAISLIPIGAVGYGGLRMLRADGYDWALGGAVTQLVWGFLHAGIVLYTGMGLGCLVAPIAFTVAMVTGTFAVVVLANPRVHLAFQAVRAHPDLLETSAATH